MEQNNKNMTPRIKTNYVDVETGEMLTKEHAEKKYVKIKCEKTTKNLGWNIEITYLWICQKNNQLTLQL